MGTVIFFKVLQWIVIGICVVLFVYSKMQKSSEMQKYASMFLMAEILMLLGYTLEMEAANLDAAYYGTILSYVGQPYVLLSAFFLISTFYGLKTPKWLFPLLCAIGTCIPIIVYTNKYHHAYYTNLSFAEDAMFSPLVIEYGALYYVNAAISMIISLTIIVMVFVGYNKSKSPMKKRLSVYSFLMVFSAVLGYVAYFLQLGNGYDTTMLGLAIGVICLSVLFFRCRIFDVVDMAKDYALDISRDGLLVYDDANSIVYDNKSAREIMEESIPKDYLDELKKGDSLYTHDESVFSISSNPLYVNNDYLGKSIEIHDISESYNYQSRLEAAVKATTEKLEHIQRTIFGSFASMVEARSLETGDHIRRVSDYTLRIAEALKKNEKYKDILDEKYINMLILSAPLHDIGKISISDTILLKPGKLTAEEFAEMKKHSAMGADVIRSTMSGLESEAYVKMAMDIAKYHHERWDGNGYPEGLKGEEIPLSARIVALADCYDAMTSKRCYKDAFPDEKALSIIKEERGTHFDPDVVDAFCESAK